MFKFCKIDAYVSWRDETVRLATDHVWYADDPFVVERPEFFGDAPTFVHHTSGYVPAGTVETLPETGIRRRVRRG